MCDMREVYLDEGREEGREEGRAEGILIGAIQMLLRQEYAKESIWEVVQKEYNCSKEEFENSFKEAEKRNRQDI